MCVDESDSGEGVFRANVEWCLVVSTPDEVILCALVRTVKPMDGMAHGDGSLKLVPTSFCLPTDNVRMLTIAGTKSGRIFMGGDDGCLYEMTYEGLLGKESPPVSVDQRLAEFYDEGKQLPSQLTVDGDNNIAQHVLAWGKRTWSNMADGLINGSNPGDQRPRKCRKLNRSSSAGSWMSAILPDVLINTGSLLFGGNSSTGGGKIVQIEIDEDRKCLYTLGSEGWICSFDFTSTASLHISAVMQAPRLARSYLEAVSRGQMIPPSSSSSVGVISFPGGGAAAQAGVGGMEGARSILKASDLRGMNGKSSKVGSILKPVSIHVITPTESQRLTLVAVTSGGLRLFISSLAPSVLSSGPNAATAGRNPLAPSSRLTLCHIRSPPPTDSSRLGDLSSVESGVVGGLKPRLIGSEIPYVDASYYNQGVFVAAVEGKAKRKTDLTGGPPSVGDVIVAACADSVARTVEPADSSSKSIPKLATPGGVTENVSLPMSSAFGSKDGGDQLLPGGIVWAIAPVGDDRTAVKKLLANSQTPTDTELSIGLPPAYFPPSKVHDRDIGRQGSIGGQGSSDTLAKRTVSPTSTAITILRNVAEQALFARPIRRGLSVQDPLNRGNAHGDRKTCRDYRISKRDGSNGFSLTAAEASRYAAVSAGQSSTSKLSRSARLRPWLLRPSTVPLNQLSTQHLEQPKQLVALNAGGLHYFGFDSTLSSLADTLMSAGENAATDPTVTSFFTSYSYKEGCAMCLALAIGCGPASGNSGYSDQVRDRACTAALSRAFYPKLVPQSDQSGSGSNVVTSAAVSDPFVPVGYEFVASEISNGLHALFSRLVRPIWNKPAVVVTEGRSIKSQWSRSIRTTPAKVEVLLNGASLEEILTPLRHLLDLMKRIFSKALRSVPGASHRMDNVMEVDDENGESHLLTRALQYHSHLRSGSGESSTSHLTAAEAETLARLMEEKNIHSLYRLLSRVVQLLNLVSLLQRAQTLPELKEVDWGLLHGLTIAQLVQTADGQDRLESLLNSLVTASAVDSASSGATSAQADQLANQFADQCYLFFSPGSRSAYLGLRRASEALTYPQGSSHRRSAGKQAADHLRDAAEHWHSAPLITGRILHTKGQETFDQIALRAKQYGSPLATAVEALMRLEDVASVVDVCLLTASNFSEKGQIGLSAVDQIGLSSSNRLGFAWEQNLYHKRRETESAGGTSSSRGAASPSSPTQLVAYGAAVTSRDAIDTCYALIFHHLSALLSSGAQSLAFEMAAECAATKDESFLNAFFLHLLENGHADTLLRITSPDLEKWLDARKDFELLWRYFNIQGKHVKAGQVAWERAMNPNLKLQLGERIDWLNRSLGAFKAALDGGVYAGQPVDDLKPKVDEVQDILNIAKLQNRILQTITSSGGMDVGGDMFERIATTLIPVSELYNDFAAALSLFEHCLMILHACRHNQIDTIQSLWKKIICEAILPCATRSDIAHGFLQQFVSDLGEGDKITFLHGNQASGSLEVFENGDWAGRLESTIVHLGMELYGTGADYVFPVDYLLAVLEGKLF